MRHRRDDLYWINVLILNFVPVNKRIFFIDRKTYWQRTERRRHLVLPPLGDCCHLCLGFFGSFGHLCPRIPVHLQAAEAEISYPS